MKPDVDGRSELVVGRTEDEQRRGVVPNSDRHDCITYHNPGWKAAQPPSRGVNVLLRDGHITFVKDSVGQGVWRGMSMRSGGEVVSVEAF